LTGVPRTQKYAGLTVVPGGDSGIALPINIPIKGEKKRGVKPKAVYRAFDAKKHLRRARTFGFIRPCRRAQTTVPDAA
jgi:hypothetical protein